MPSLIHNDFQDKSHHHKHVNNDELSVASTQSWNLDNRIFPALINSMTSKLRHFALSGFHNLTFHGVEKFLLHFHKTLQSIDFSELSLVDDAILKVIGDNFQNLFVIKFNHCRQITDAGMMNLFPVGKSILVEVLIIFYNFICH